MARLISRSKNSHMRSPRRVTLAPMALPSRSLKPAIDFLARVTIGFWPVMIVEVGDGALEQRLAWPTAAPTPMLMTIFSSRGTSMTLPSPSASLQLGADLVVVPLLEPRDGSLGGRAHPRSPSHLRQMRTFVPSGSKR